ncbi:Hypothetical protein SCF082_LOCUS28617 [Durusdinium trenchii]
MDLKAALLVMSIMVASATPASPAAPVPGVHGLRGNTEVNRSNSSSPSGHFSNHSSLQNSLSPENLTGYLLEGFRAFAKALGMESAFNETTRSGEFAKSKNCLCIFDVDRTLTGKQGDTRRCPANKVVGGYDDAYGGGEVTLSHLGQYVWGTWCGQECHIRGISAHHRARPNIPVPQNVLSCNRGCKAEKARKMAEELGIRKSQVYMFDDKASNIRPFHGTGMNAHQISCSTRDGDHGLCGATTREVRREKGVSTCR